MFVCARVCVCVCVYGCVIDMETGNGCKGKEA